ncbi:putative enzyme related to lactoylglutathione lyase [Prauserella shujinwangii]|uniref:Putative enzyme related to lactoylglutathione lyase n=1 Tax=Prauserella shujinwangii TaxID=1453103 RepID=A0A2T0LP24_9PSEU|nr:VOC family protein [Prauserella shujinwangii]PRX44985.1 putative enzyme related to lactoylglutathione lyase [Prauserella shujinwangii]
MDIKKLQFVSVPVADHVRAKDFYLTTLGFESLLDREGPHGRFVLVAPRGAETGVVLVDFTVDGRGFGGPVHLQFHTDDVDSDHAALRAAGVDAEPPQDMPWGRTTSFTDPDGNPISLLQPSALGARPA